MRTYTALLVDDEAANRSLLHNLLQKHCGQISHIQEAASVKEAEKVLQSSSIDLLFLDIEMPRENGFDLLNKLTKIPFKIIFVTAYDAYALKAIKYSALDYLLKPVDKDELIAAVDKLDSISGQQAQIDLLNFNLQNEAQRRIALSTQDEVLFVELNNILRLQAEANYTRVYLVDEGPILLSGNLGYYEKLLNDPQFYRCHQSHLINVQKVKKFVKTEGGYFVMQEGSQVPISRLKREEVKRLFMS